MKSIVKWIIRVTKPYVWRLAEAYDIKVERHCHPSGQYPLDVADGPEMARHHIPKSVYFNTRSGRISVGKNVIFGEDVKVLTGKHMNIEEANVAGVSLHHVPEGRRDIIIEEGCYIGSGAIIVGPVMIGNHSVIGAGAVVTRDVPPQTFVAGVPAKVVRTLSASGA
ncbi:acyltransferase [Sideroxydans sp.]